MEDAERARVDRWLAKRISKIPDIEEWLNGQRKLWIAQETGPQADLVSGIWLDEVDMVVGSLEHGADANGVDTGPDISRGSMMPLLFIAAGWRLNETDKSENVELVEALLSHGADVNTQSPEDGATILYWCAWEEKWNLAQLLLGYGADPNCWDERGNTALMWASHPECAPPDVIKNLLALGARPDDVDIKGRTALMCAASGNEVAVQLLLEHGADPRMKNSEGQTALDVAIAANAPQAVVDLLVGAGG